MPQNNFEESKHPDVAKIPKKLLSGEPFYGYIPEQYLAYISCELEAIQGKLNVDHLRPWICITVARQHIDAGELIKKAGQLGISSEVILEGAVLINRLDILDRLSEDTDVIRVLQNTIIASRFFCGALEQGHLAVLEKLTLLFPKNAANFFTTDAHLLYFAAVDGQIEILNWLETKIDPETTKYWIRQHNFEMFNKAAQAGHAESLTWIVEQIPENFADMVGAVENTGKATAQLSILGSGHEAAAAFNKQWDALNSFPGFRSAVYHGHVPVLNWFKQRVTSQDLQCMIEACLEDFTLATGGGRLASIMWLEQEAPQTCLMLISKDEEEIISSAQAEENNTVVEWVKAKIGGIKKEVSSVAALGHFGHSALAGEQKQLESLALDSLDKSSNRISRCTIS